MPLCRYHHTAQLASFLFPVVVLRFFSLCLSFSTFLLIFHIDLQERSESFSPVLYLGKLRSRELKLLNTRAGELGPSPAFCPLQQEHLHTGSSTEYIREHAPESNEDQYYTPHYTAREKKWSGAAAPALYYSPEIWPLPASILNEEENDINHQSHMPDHSSNVLNVGVSIQACIFILLSFFSSKLFFQN